MQFTELDIKALKHVLTEMSDEELTDHFGDVFITVKERLKPIKDKIRRKEMAVYSNQKQEVE